MDGISQMDIPFEVFQDMPFVENEQLIALLFFDMSEQLRCDHVEAHSIGQEIS